MRRVLVLSLVAGVGIGLVQLLLLRQPPGVAVLSGAIAFLVALLALGVAHRYGRRD